MSLKTVTKKIVVGRPINGISINGLEYLLGENDEPMKFDNVKSAKTFLKKHGVTNFEDIVFKTIGEDEK